jgi:undecaprenyl-diphosphatase
MNTRISRLDLLGLLAISLGLLLFKFWLTRAAGLEMHFDEAQYWTWSRQLDWSYATKGPLLAWLIALSESLSGHGDWQVRLPGWIAASLFLVLLHLFARDLWQSRSAGWWALLLGLLTPLYFVLGLVMTTDVFLFLFWTWGLWAAYRALTKGQRWAWYELGAATGLGVLAKLSMGLLPAAVGLLVLLHPDYRRHLRDRHVWGGILLLILIMTPVLLWNATHDWVMIRHNAGHVSSDAWSLSGFGEFLLGQWLALSPLVALVALVLLWRRPAQAAARIVWYVSLGCLVFFLFKAVSARILINWPAPVYIGFLVLLAGHIGGLSKSLKGLLWGGILFSVVIVFIGLAPTLVGLPDHQGGLKKLRAWRLPVSELARQAGQVDFLLAPDYRLASELAFYWPSQTPVYLWGNPGRRFNQYDIWPGPEEEQAGRKGLFVSTDAHRLEALSDVFNFCIQLPEVEAVTRDGGVVRTFYPVRCGGFKGKQRFVPDHY